MVVIEVGIALAAALASALASALALLLMLVPYAMGLEGCMANGPPIPSNSKSGPGDRGGKSGAGEGRALVGENGASNGE